MFMASLIHSFRLLYIFNRFDIDLFKLNVKLLASLDLYPGINKQFQTFD